MRIELSSAARRFSIDSRSLISNSAACAFSRSFCAEISSRCRIEASRLLKKRSTNIAVKNRSTKTAAPAQMCWVTRAGVISFS